MQIRFRQTVSLAINESVNEDFLLRLPDVIYRDTDFRYSCLRSKEGCVLKPQLRNMPYRNSFVPELNVWISEQDGKTSVKIQGRPIKAVRVFMTVWFGFLALFGLYLGAVSVFSGLDSILPLFIPPALCILGYALCKILFYLTFRSVIKSVGKECGILPDHASR